MNKFTFGSRTLEVIRSNRADPIIIKNLLINVKGWGSILCLGSDVILAWLTVHLPF